MAVSPHAIVIEALSLLQFRRFPASWVSPSLLDHPRHCTNCPGNLPSYKELSVFSTWPSNYSIILCFLLQQHLWDEIYLYLPAPRPHLPFSFQLVFIWLLSSLSWKLLQHDSFYDALGPVLVITCFLFILLDLSAAFVILLVSSSASSHLHPASLMAPSQSFLAGCFSAVWFLTVGVPRAQAYNHLIDMFYFLIYLSLLAEL